MTACVRELYGRMGALDPELRGRLADWLAFHLSNFDFIWPWQKWGGALAAPPGDAQRAFCADLLRRLAALSYHEKVAGLLEGGGAEHAGFLALLGPKPLPRLAPPPAAAAPAAEPRAAEGDAAAGGDAAMAPAPGAEEEGDAEGVWAGRLLAEVRAKASADDLLAWLAAQGAREALGGPLGALRALARALLHAGAKSFTHTHVAFERHAPALAALAAELPGDGAAAAAAAALLDAAAAVWADAPQRLAATLDRMLEAGVVAPEAAAGWLLATWAPAAAAAGGEGPAGALPPVAWQLLHMLLARGKARVEVAAAAAAEAAAAAAAATAEADAAEDASARDEPAAMETEGGGGASPGHRGPDAGAARQRAAEAGERASAAAAALEEVTCVAQDRLLLAAYDGFAAWLASGAGAAAGAADLRAFVRHYCAETARVAGALEAGAFGPGAAPPAVRAAFAAGLRLPPPRGKQ